MISCAAWSYSSICLMIFKVRISFFIAVLLFALVTWQTATCTSLKGQKAVFKSVAASRYGTLSPGTNIPTLNNFTLCVYFRPTQIIENGMMVFTYNSDRKHSSRSSRYHELGIMIKNSSLIFWLFGREVKLDYRFSLNKWYHLCLMWNNANHETYLYLNERQIHTESQLQNYKLFPNGSLLLGQSHKRKFDRLRVDLELAFVGDLYMFSLWNYTKNHEISNLGCEDGNIIKWDSQQWDFMDLPLEYDNLLPCCHKFMEVNFKRSEYENYGTRKSRHLLAHSSTTSITFPPSSSAGTQETSDIVMPSSLPSTPATSIITHNTSSGSISAAIYNTTNITFIASNSSATSNKTDIISNGSTSAATSNTISVPTSPSNSTAPFSATRMPMTPSISTASSTTTHNTSGGSISAAPSRTTHMPTTQSTSTAISITTHITSSGSISAAIYNTTNITFIASNSSATSNKTDIISNGSTTAATSNTISVPTSPSNSTALFSTTKITLTPPSSEGAQNTSDTVTSSSSPSTPATSVKTDITINRSTSTATSNPTSIPTTSSNSTASISATKITLTLSSSEATFNTTHNTSSGSTSSAPSSTTRTTSAASNSTGNIYYILSRIKPPSDQIENVCQQYRNRLCELSGNYSLEKKENATVKWSSMNSICKNNSINAFEVILVCPNVTKHVCSWFYCATKIRLINESIVNVYKILEDLKEFASNSTFVKESFEDKANCNDYLEVCPSTIPDRPINCVFNKSILISNEEDTCNSDPLLTIVTADNAAEVANALLELSGNTAILTAADISLIVSKLNEILDVANVVPGLAETLVGTVSNLLNASVDVLASSSTRMVQSVDKIGLRLNFSTDSVKISSTSLALAVTKINVMGFSGANFSISNITDLQVSLGEESPQTQYAAIQLPNSLLTNLQTQDVDLASRIQFSFYEKDTVFQDTSLSETSILNSYIIASSVANLSITKLVNPVRITLRNLQFNENTSDVQCVFWNFDKNSGQGGWSVDGCRVVQKTVNETMCECDHLTNFAVLLDLSRKSSDDRILTFITYVGCGISAVFLSVTLVTYLSFEKLRRDYPSKILINLCTALLFLNMVFLIDSWISAYKVNGLCIAVAVFLHYFLLASFTWMSLEAFHMYLALVKVFNTYVRRYMLKFCIAGWTIPAVVVAIVLIIGPDNYGLGKYGKGTENSWDVFCWIKNDIVFYVAVVAYFCLMFLVNLSMFIVVMIQLCRIKHNKQQQHVQKNIFQDMKSVAGLTFLLGITWGFAFFAWGPVNQAFTYLFTIFNSLQGFFIFIFHCVAKETVRKQWRTYLCCGKYRLPENSEWSRTATNNTKKLQPVVHAMSLSSASNNSLHSSSTNNSMVQIREYSPHPNIYENINAETSKASRKMSSKIALLREPSSR